VALFTAVAEADAPAGRTWAVMVDWPAHGDWVPLTEVRVLTPSGEGVGARFVGRTGVGRLAFDDPMEVVQWTPPLDGRPGFCRVVKQGRLVTGAAWFEVTPLPRGRSRVTWTEDIEVTPARLTRPFGALVALAGRVAFTRVLRKAAVQAAAEPGAA